MILATTQRSPADYVSQAVVRLEAIGENGETVGWSSGFLIDERDFLSLYTCWHVISGADPHSLPANPPTKRVKLRVHTLRMEYPAPGVIRIGGQTTLELDLFDGTGQRTWYQNVLGDKDNDVELPIPLWDCVRLDVSKFRSLFPGAFQPEDDILNGLDISEDAFIVGYPYGYSPIEDSPHPVFIRRTRACIWQPDARILLDGPGAKGMSGGPVVTRIENEWRLAGIYTGVVFPESTHFQNELKHNDGLSRLPLGKYLPSVLARKVIGVSANDIFLR